MVCKRFYCEIVTLIAVLVLFQVQVILYFNEWPQDNPVKDSDRVVNVKCTLESNIASLPEPARGTKV